MIVFPDKFIVGFQKRNLDYKTNDKGGHYHMGYLVTDSKLTSWQDWRDKKIAPMEIINTPRSEYRIFGRTQRSRDWFGSGRSMVYIEHPDGFVFEITVDNLIGIHAHMDTVEGEFKGELILAKDGKNLLLIPVNSEEYNTVLRNTIMKKAKAISAKTIKPGTKYLTKKNETFIYLGKHLIATHVSKGRYPAVCNITYMFKEAHLVLNESRQPIVVSSLDAFEIIKEDFINENECATHVDKYKYIATKDSKFSYRKIGDGNGGYNYTQLIEESDKKIVYNEVTRYNNRPANDLKDFKRQRIEVYVETYGKQVKL